MGEGEGAVCCSHLHLEKRRCAALAGENKMLSSLEAHPCLPLSPNPGLFPHAGIQGKVALGAPAGGRLWSHCHGVSFSPLVSGGGREEAEIKSRQASLVGLVGYPCAKTFRHDPSTVST